MVELPKEYGRDRAEVIPHTANPAWFWQQISKGTDFLDGICRPQNERVGDAELPGIELVNKILGLTEGARNFSFCQVASVEATAA